MIAGKREDEIHHPQRRIAREHDDGQRQPEMRLPVGRSEHDAHQEQDGGLETFVHDGLHGEQRLRAGTHIVVRRADQHADGEQQQQLPHADAEGKQRYRHAECQPEPGDEIAPEIDKTLSRRSHDDSDALARASM